MVNLKNKPYYLDDEAIEWVENTINSMSIEEKIGQLFVVMLHGAYMTEENIKSLIGGVHPGAIRYMNMSADKLWEQNNLCQKISKVPLLIASNCENGGNGGVGGGTTMANGPAIAAIDDEKVAYEVGRVGAVESASVGCNWNFAPVVDLLYNWRNTIVQLRGFNDSPEDTIHYAKAWNKATREVGLADCVKHFPGDGCDENDQHLCLTINDKDAEEWMNTYGKVYKELIDDGLKSVMVGHIAQPAWQRKLSKEEVKDSDILPASLCPELVEGLLRKELGFNGLVVTDASHMIGMMASMPREEMLPRCIAAGCDLFLFMNDVQEDFKFMMQGYQKGIITEERLSDALHRILGLKAALNLHKKQKSGTLMPNKEGTQVVGCKEHLKIAEKLAEQFITLVKDTQNNLPITPEKHKKLQLVFVGGDNLIVAGQAMASTSDACKEVLVRELEKEGFEVTAVEGVDMATRRSSIEELKNKYDATLVAIDTTGFCQYNTMRMKWATQAHQPWYCAEIPTVFVSFNLPNILIDLNMSHTFINCYLDTPEVVKKFVEKLVGRSPFTGRFNENVWCGRWDTRL